MASFDIVSEVDMQEVENAVNNTRKTIAQRYDFRDTNTAIDLDKKGNKMKLETSDTMKLQALNEELAKSLAKRGVDATVLDRKDHEPASGGRVRQEIALRHGIDKDTARKIVKIVKDTKLKVQAQIQDEQVRVQGKKIDDLQSVIQAVKESKLGLPLQYVNMKS